MSPGAKLTYAVLACCRNGRHYVWPSPDYLTQCVSASFRTIRRYMRELADFGLIRIRKKYFMGQFRTIYIFLNNALVTFESKTPPAEKKRTRKANPPAPAERTKNANQGDKNDTPYNKEESFFLENNITPPTPPKAESPVEAELPMADAASGEGEVFKPGVKEDDSKGEDPAWVQAKKLLAERLSQFDLKSWIEPIVFEKGECQAVLRMPNEFFLAQVKRKFGTEITEAFKAAGIPELRFDLLTSEQKAALEKQATIMAEREARKQEMAAVAAAEAERRAQAEMENLAPEKKFDLLWSVYPVNKELDAAKRVFMRLYRKGELPSMAELIRSIRDHRARDRWWREKMPPLLSNWLSKKKWRDKPYE